MKEINQRRIIALKIEPLQSSLTRPTLELARKGQGSLLLASFAGALGFSAGLCGLLASILITFQLMQPDVTASSMSVLFSNAESKNPPQLDSAQKSLTKAPSRLATIPIAPSKKAMISTSSEEIPAPVLEIPITEIKPTDPLVLEELDLENPL